MLPDVTLQSADFKDLTNLEKYGDGFTIINVMLMQILVKKMCDGYDPQQNNNSLKKMHPYDSSIRVLSSKFYKLYY